MSRSLALRVALLARSAIFAPFLLTQCVSSYEVLEEKSTEGGFSDCFEALSVGFTGDRCSRPFTCEGAPREPDAGGRCCKTLASCNANTLAISVECSACECDLDSDCGPGAWCINHACKACSVPKTCRGNFGFVERNGCLYCVRLGVNGAVNCRSDADCTNGNRCFPGATCFTGCAPGDPSCCFGNACAAPACGPIASFDCALVGCPDGKYCDIVDPDQHCECMGDRPRWYCTVPGNVCKDL